MTKIRIKNIMTIFILITSFSVWILSLFISFQQESTKRKNLLNAEFISVTTQFEKNIDISLTFIHGLEGFTYSQIDKEIDTETFNTFSTVTQNPNNFIKNFSIAPNNIQVYVYPLEGNEVTLEHNLATDEREQVRNDVELAQSLKKSVISGPYELRQGGLGMVIRTPIFESDQYWGLVNVVVDLQKIIDLSFQIESGNLKYSIENMDGVFWPTQEVNAPLFKKEIIVEEDTWIVSASLTRKYDSSFIFNVFSNNLLIFLTIFIVTIFLVKILNKNILLSSRVKRLIYIDSLTNLPNRMMLMENLELLYQSKIEFGLAFIDLDNFKNINDNLGHKLGDRILTVLSTRFSTQQSINVYRWGGDEFILIGPNLNKESFTKKIQEIINNVSIPIIIDNKMFNIQVTTGITHTSSDGTDIDQLISKADLALNHAKTEKKGSIKIFDSTVSEKSAHFFKF
jgi:diguanylate cyclase (GGDEF)-like protein